MWEKLKHAVKPIVLYGMGNGADMILNHAENLHIPIAGVFASDGFARGQTFRGFPVTTYREAKEKFGDMIVLLSFGTHLPQVMEQILSIGREQELYAPDFPVAGSTLFTPDFFSEHLTDYKTIHSALQDEISRSVLENICQFKLTGKLDHLLACQTAPGEIYQSFLTLSDNEDFVDLGAYRGDTIKEFLQSVNDYHSILALEPDVRSFRHLQENCGSFPRCRLINCGAYSHSATLFFAGNVGRGGTVAVKGRETSMVSVDSLLAGERASYIKIDVEGMEEKAIEGMEKTIRRYKPKLCVSAYHRSEDLFFLPQQILTLNPDYKVYLRHFPCFPSWNVNYYFI